MTDPLPFWRQYLNPKPLLADPRPSVLRVVGDRLAEARNYVAALDHAEHRQVGLAVATLAVDLACKVLDRRGLECLGGAMPPLLTLKMADLAIGNLLATVRGHYEAWLLAACQNDPGPEAPEDDAGNVAADDALMSSGDLVIDHAEFTFHYKGTPCRLGNTKQFYLFIRLAQFAGKLVSHLMLATDVWHDDLVEPSTIYKQVSLLKNAIRAAGIEGVVIDGDTMGHYRLILS